MNDCKTSWTASHLTVHYRKKTGLTKTAQFRPTETQRDSVLIKIYCRQTMQQIIFTAILK